MKTVKIHLIRHGQTEANARGLYIGSRTDLPLSGTGVKKLLAMKEQYVYPSATRFYTSPMTRCKQTLQVLYAGCEPIVVDDLRECNFGEWDGQSVEQLKADEGFQKWITGEQAEIPGGEAAMDFQTRVMAAFEQTVWDLLKSNESEAVICTHGGVIMMLMAAYAFPRAPMHEWAAEDGAGFTLLITPSMWMREPVAEAIASIPLLLEKE